MLNSGWPNESLGSLWNCRVHVFCWISLLTRSLPSWSFSCCDHQTTVLICYCFDYVFRFISKTHNFRKMSKDECCYLCNECPASFTSLDSLEDHLKSGQHILARTESSPKVLVNTVDVTVSKFRFNKWITPQNSLFFSRRFRILTWTVKARIKDLLNLSWNANKSHNKTHFLVN